MYALVLSNVHIYGFFFVVRYNYCKEAGNLEQSLNSSEL